MYKQHEVFPKHSTQSGSQQFISETEQNPLLKFCFKTYYQEFLPLFDETEVLEQNKSAGYLLLWLGFNFKSPLNLNKLTISHYDTEC